VEAGDSDGGVSDGSLHGKELSVRVNVNHFSGRSEVPPEERAEPDVELGPGKVTLFHAAGEHTSTGR
jgi:hypothetical protein